MQLLITYKIVGATRGSIQENLFVKSTFY